MKTLEQIEIVGSVSPEFAEILTPEALSFISELHYEFNAEREALLKRRAERQVEWTKASCLIF